MNRYILRHDQAKFNCLTRISALEVDEKHPMEVVIKKFQNSRTLEQNNKLHAMFGTLADYTGYSIEDIKDYLMEELGFIVTREVNGKLITRRMSTAKMSVGELSGLIEQIYAWAAENGIDV